MIIPEEYRKEIVAKAQLMLQNGAEVMAFNERVGVVLRDESGELAVTRTMISWRPSVNRPEDTRKSVTTV